MDIWAICVDQALSGQTGQVLWRAFGFDHKALFGS